MKKSIFFCMIFVFVLSFITINGQEDKCNIDSDLKKIKENIFFEFNQKRLDSLRSIYNELTPNKKKCLIKYIEKKYPNSNCTNVIFLFSLFHDDSLLPIMLKKYHQFKKTDLLAECEIYFICTNYNKQLYINKFIQRLDLSKKGDEALIYSALPVREKKIVKAMFKQYSKGKYADSSGEMWYGIMSWMERDERWLSQEYDQYLEERIKSENY